MPPSSCADEVRKTLDHWGHGLVGGPVIGRSRHDLKLMNALALLAVNGPQAIGPGVTAADDDDVLAAGGDEVVFVDRVARYRGGFDRSGTAWRSGCRSRSRPSIGRSRGWVAPPQRQMASNRASSSCGGYVDADVGRRPENDSFGLHLFESTVEEPLFHLEVRDSVTEQAADAVGSLEDGDRVARAGELLGTSQPGRARSRRPRPSCRSAPRAVAARPSLRSRPCR